MSALSYEPGTRPQHNTDTSGFLSLRSLCAMTEVRLRLRTGTTNIKLYERSTSIPATMQELVRVPGKVCTDLQSLILP